MSSGTLRNPASIVKWHRMRRLFRACYFFRERTQKKRQLGIRAFFTFERCERNTVLVAEFVLSISAVVC